VVDQGGDVIDQEPDIERPVDVGGAAMALQVDGDGLVALGQGGKDRPEHLPDPSPPCSRSIGRPAPWVSTQRLIPLTWAYWPVPCPSVVPSLAVTAMLLTSSLVL
jgi:hypothetical protein